VTFVPDLGPEDFGPEVRYAVTGPNGELRRTFNIFHKLAHSPVVCSNAGIGNARDSLRDEIRSGVTRTGDLHGHAPCRRYVSISAAHRGRTAAWH